NTASPSNTAVSPNFGIAGKSSFVDPSKYLDDPNMPELEDIVYSDDEEDGYTQEEGIDYNEVFAPVARIEATRLFLAYASFMGFMVYQMDVKSAFLYETIEEEVYVCNLQDLKTLIILIRFTRWSKHSMGCIKLQELGMKHWQAIY
nr:copia protein [Tanacetum cinerariifolium]